MLWAHSALRGLPTGSGAGAKGACVSSEQSRGLGSPRTESRGVGGGGPPPSSSPPSSLSQCPHPSTAFQSVSPCSAHPQHTAPKVGVFRPQLTAVTSREAGPGVWAECSMDPLLSASPQRGLGGHASFSPSSGRPHRRPHARPERRSQDCPPLQTRLSPASSTLTLCSFSPRSDRRGSKAGRRPRLSGAEELTAPADVGRQGPFSC